MLGDRKTVILRGGTPWGFRLSGGGQTPIYISKVRSGSKAAFGGLTTGDTLISVNGIPTIQHSLLETNDVIDTIRDQLVLEVKSSTQPFRFRLDSTSGLDSKETSPIRSIHRRTPQSQAMDYQQYNSRNTSAYPSFTSTSGFNQNNTNRDPRYIDSYGRSTTNPLPAIFRTAAATSNIPTTSARGQQFSYRPTSANPVYDTPRSYNDGISSGYVSDTNDLRRSSISIRPISANNSTARRVSNTNNNNQQSFYSPSPVTYNTKITTGNDQNYYSDSEYVTSGPRYTKISRQVNSVRRPSNVVLPIRSVTSKAYDEYVPPEPPRPQQQLIDVYRYQQEQREREQRERERQEQFQRQLYQQQQQAAVAAARYKPPQLTFPTQEQRRKSDTTIDHELGAELLKSPIANKKRYADSAFFSTPYNTYPTIEEQKKMARKIANILEGGDPTQKGATKFEKQRQRAEKYTLESEPTTPTLSTSNYRPLRPLQTNGSPYYNASDVPDFIKNSINEAQHTNTLRFVGAPEEFKQMHMQEHVTHTNVPPQAAMSLVADLNQNRGKGAALFQKRKARSEKWVIDENNVKKSGYKPTSSYIGPSTKPWGQHAPSSWSGDEGPYSGPSFSPVRPKYNPPPNPSVPESILSPPPTQNVPRYGDFNAKPKGFGAWNAENTSPRGSVDLRKPLNLSMEPSIREGIAESHTRTASQPWSPPYNTQSTFSPNQPQTNDYFNYPSDSTLAKWKNQEYSPWNQPRGQGQQQSQIPMTREGVDQLRQRLMQQNQSSAAQQQQQQQYKQYATYKQQSGNQNAANYNPYSSSQGSTQQQHFTDL